MDLGPTSRSLRAGAILLFGMMPALAGCGPRVQTAGHTKVPGEDPAGQTKPPVQEGTPLVLADPTSTTEPPLPAQRPTLYADIPEGGRLVGTEGAIAVEALSQSGHWAAVCQADPQSEKPGSTSLRGDPLSPLRLVFSTAKEQRDVDALLAVEPSGRYVVLVEKGEAFLVDAVSGERASLATLKPDLEADSLPDHRSFAFAGDSLLVLATPNPSEPGARGHIVSLFSEGQTLTTSIASARSIDWGQRPVWRLFGGPMHAHAATLPAGSTKSAWPVPGAKEPLLRCGNATRSYVAYERLTALRPDPTLEVAWLELSNKTKQSLSAQIAPGYVMSVGARWVRREASGRLVLVDGKVQQQIASARCGARIMRADAPSGLFLVACEEYAPDPPEKTDKKETPRYRFDLNLVRPGFVRALRADVARTGVDVAGPVESTLFVVRPGAEAALVDFRAKSMTTLPGEVQVLATSATAALLRRGKHLSVWTRRGEEPIDLEVPALAPVLVRDRAASVDRTVFVLEAELTSWNLPAAPLALTSQGYALVPKKGSIQGRLPEGPLLLIGPPEKQAALPADSPEARPAPSPAP